MKKTLSTAGVPRFHGKAPRRGATFLRDVVRRVRCGLQHPAPVEHNLLSDISRERYNSEWLARFIEIAAKCERDAEAFALPNAIAAEIAARRPMDTHEPLELLHTETEMQSAADIAVTDALVHRSATAAEAALEAIDAHILSLTSLKRRLAPIALGISR